MNFIQKLLGVFGYPQPEETKPTSSTKQEKRFRDLGNPVSSARVREAEAVQRRYASPSRVEPVKPADPYVDHTALNLAILATLSTDTTPKDDTTHHQPSHDFGHAADSSPTPSSSDSAPSQDSSPSPSYDTGSSSSYDSGSSSSFDSGGGGGFGGDGGGAAFAPQMQ